MEKINTIKIRLIIGFKNLIDLCNLHHTPQIAQNTKRQLSRDGESRFTFSIGLESMVLMVSHHHKPGNHQCLIWREILPEDFFCISYGQVNLIPIVFKHFSLKVFS